MYNRRDKVLLGVFADVDPEVVKQLGFLHEKVRPVYIDPEWADEKVFTTCLEHLHNPLIAVDGEEQSRISIACERNGEEGPDSLLLSFSQRGKERRLRLSRSKDVDGTYLYRRDDRAMEYYEE